MKGLSIQAVRNFPAMVSIEKAAQAVGIAQTTAYKLIGTNSFPVPVVKIGGVFRVRRADLLRFLEGSPSTIAASGRTTAY